MNEKDINKKKSTIRVPRPEDFKPSFNDKEKKDISKYNFKTNYKKTIFFYLGMGLNILLPIIGWAYFTLRYVLFAKPFTFWIIVFMVIAIPVFLSGIVGLAIKLFFDRKKISDKVTELLSKNYIIADFYTSSKRIISAVRPINSDGISFSIGKREYTVDKEEIWYDSKKRPHSFYLPELPTPIKFNFAKTIGAYFEKVKEARKDKTALYQNTVENDLAFSSLNLQLLKKDKIFKDLNTQEGTVSQKTMSSMMVFAGAVIFVMLVVIIVIAVA